MPVLKTTVTSTKHILPSTKDAEESEQAWVTLRDKVRIATMELIAQAQHGTEVDRAINGMLDYITDWNYTDANGDKLPITSESLRNLDWTDFYFIKETMQQHIEKDSEGLSTVEKKTSTDTSKAFTTLTPPSSPPQTITPSTV
jgi:hypothetical protein